MITEGNEEVAARRRRRRKILFCGGVGEVFGSDAEKDVGGGRADFVIVVSQGTGQNGNSRGGFLVEFCERMDCGASHGRILVLECLCKCRDCDFGLQPDAPEGRSAGERQLPICVGCQVGQWRDGDFEVGSKVPVAVETQQQCGLLATLELGICHCGYQGWQPVLSDCGKAAGSRVDGIPIRRAIQKGCEFRNGLVSLRSENAEDCDRVHGLHRRGKGPGYSALRESDWQCLREALGGGHSGRLISNLLQQDWKSVCSNLPDGVSGFSLKSCVGESLIGSEPDLIPLGEGASSVTGCVFAAQEQHGSYPCSQSAGDEGQNLRALLHRRHRCTSGTK